jgi:hypothetical protein
MSEPRTAIDRVGDFIGRLVDDPSERGVALALEADPGAGGALLEFLHARFVLAEEGFGRLEDDAMFWRLVAILASRWSGAERQRFLAETLFRAAAPDAYRWLAPLVAALFTPEEAEREVLKAIERGDLAARVNASHLAYYLFDGTPEYALSEVGRKRLRDADPLRTGDDG